MESPHDSQVEICLIICNFLRRKIYFSKKVAVTHRNTIISHLVYMKFVLPPVCVVSMGRLSFHKGNMICKTELQFNCNHTDLKLCDLSLEYCYGLFQAIKYSIAN